MIPLQNKIEITILSSLEKIYHGDTLPPKNYEGFSMLKNEKKSFQIAIECENDFIGYLNINSKIKKYRVYTVEHIKSDLPMSKKSDNYFRLSKEGYYPDLLLPVNGEIKFKTGLNILWVEVIADENCVGENDVVISVYNDETIVEKNISIEVIDALLDFNNFIYTCWFHTDCLMSYYNVEAFSDKYWYITENFLRTAAEYGMNCVLTPLFTPPLDTEKGKERPTVQLVDVFFKNNKYSFNFDKLTKWIYTAKKCGIKYFEMSHFYTQWGAGYAPKIMADVDGEYKKIFGWETKSSSKEYRRFLKLFSVELKKYLEQNNLKNNVFFHVSDEPNFKTLLSYSKASDYIHKLFKEYKIIDALSDIWFHRLNIVSNPIPSNDHIDKFLGKCENLWTYYCSAQNKKYVSNRFFCNPSVRTRVIGYQMFKFDIKGFLHWGYNFYYTRLSKSLIDPYKISDAGGSFPSGDSYIVYPSPDGHAYHSIRLKVFYDALQDMAALNTLKNLSHKQKCLNIIEEDGKHKITFSDYPHSDEWLLNTREIINKSIKELL